MMGSDIVSMDLSLGNIWKSWFAFRRGKRATSELDDFQYNLEANLHSLFRDLNSGIYRHGIYRKFVAHDNKRREISVAQIRDRVVHRLIYDYLVPIYDKTFIYDAWSCRKGKGLLGAIERTQVFLKKTPCGYAWKADIQKFFDSVDQEVLMGLVSRKVGDPKALGLIREVTQSFSSTQVFGVQRERERAHREKGRVGMPIGNLTSQIFANIYLNELDRFVKHGFRVKHYLRYGDDFILVHPNLETLQEMRERTLRFLGDSLKLRLNPKNYRIIKVRHNLKFLGVVIYPGQRKLSKRNESRIKRRLSRRNVGSYFGLVAKHGSLKSKKEFTWLVCDLIAKEFQEPKVVLKTDR